MKKLLYISLIIFASSFIITACQDEEAQSIDERLMALLEEEANGLGLDFYKFPGDGQYHLFPQDPNNPITAQKVALGKLLFHETALGLSPMIEDHEEFYSCASCHHVQGGFQACMPQGIGDGGAGFGLTGIDRFMASLYQESDLDVQAIRTPSALNVAYQKNMLWNGQFGATGVNAGTESVWDIDTPLETNYLGFEGVETQAIAGIKVHRLDIKNSIAENDITYIDLFEEVFPNAPANAKATRVNAGLAIAAYERTLVANQAPFQLWLKGDFSAMTTSQKKGAMLFFGKAGCSNCHTGPALNDMQFHALGMKDLHFRDDVFKASEASSENKGRAGFTDNPTDMYKFKTPQLYNLKDSPFYGHGASFETVREVIEYKNNAIKENHKVPDFQLSEHFVALDLDEDDIDALVDFIENALYDPNLRRYVPDVLPSGNCFPNNDPQSRLDLGCGE